MPIGLVLLATAASACITAESECHRRAIAMLSCCPFCDEDCEVSKDASAQFAEESCLAELKQKQDDGPALGGHVGVTDTDDPGESTFGSTWP